MRRKTKGQSLVEMALLFPIMIIVLFGIIDFGWYVYGYATVYMASRSGAEKATMLPPKESRVGAGVTPDAGDRNCVGSILNQIGKTGEPFFKDLESPSHVEISYPSGKRAEGEPIQVRVSYTVQPLTPLWNMVPIFGDRGALTMTVTTRRTIEVLGLNPNQRYSPNLTACN